VAAKGGVKIKHAAPDDPPAPWPKWFPTVSDAKSKTMEGKIFAGMEGPGITGITARRVAIAQLVDTLEENVLHAPTVDRTGLTGQYYFAFKFVTVDAPADADSSTPTIFDALQELLGLRLERRTVSVKMLVVDHVEKTPTEN
jgi:uncharacterized protein (TIGR03435 family)